MKFIQTDREVALSKNYELLVHDVAKSILEASNKAIQERGVFNIALSGGLAARGVYATMSGPHFRQEFNWEKMHFFWTDERWVGPEHARSNYGLVAEVLLTRVDIPIENIHPIRTSAKTPEISAICYEETLRSYLTKEVGEMPKFDLILFELGKSGNIASIFSDHEALVEKKRLVVAVRSDDLYEERVTMTLPVINHSEQMIVLASGRERSEILQKIFEGSFNDHGLPAQLLNPARGNVTWMVDGKAASKIDGLA